MPGGNQPMRLSKHVSSWISLMVLGAFLLSTCLPVTVIAATPDCNYDAQSPSLEHAVQEFMDPARFKCAEEEIIGLLSITPPGDKSTVARARFLLAGALFGQTLTTDIPQSKIVDELVLGFLANPEWNGPWYFKDMPGFMELVPAAKVTADSLLACPYDAATPSTAHAREMMIRYGLFNCAADEAMAAINMQLSAEAIDSFALAEGHFVLGQAYYGEKLIGAESVTDSIIIDHLTTGFILTWEYMGNWLFDDREEFISLTQEARMLAEAERGGHGGFFRKSTIIVAGIGAAVAGALVALLVSGNDEPATTVDTIPSFPQPPGQ